VFEGWMGGEGEVRGRSNPPIDGDPRAFNGLGSPEHRESKRGQERSISRPMIQRGLTIHQISSSSP
jgi:hypothetical protein